MGHSDLSSVVRSLYGMECWPEGTLSAGEVENFASEMFVAVALAQQSGERMDVMYAVSTC